MSEDQRLINNNWNPQALNWISDVSTLAHFPYQQLCHLPVMIRSVQTCPSLLCMFTRGLILIGPIVALKNLLIFGGFSEVSQWRKLSGLMSFLALSLRYSADNSRHWCFETEASLYPLSTTAFPTAVQKWNLFSVSHYLLMDLTVSRAAHMIHQFINRWVGVSQTFS